MASLEYQRKYYWENREKLRAYHAQWKRDHPMSEEKKQEARERASRWYKDNADKAKKRILNWQRANPEKVKANRLKCRESILAGQRKCYHARREYYMSQSKEWARANPARRREIGRKWAHNANLKKLKLSKSAYLKMFEDQDNRCAICSAEFVGKTKACLDHCHATGKVRALLCPCCNTGLGMFKDRETFLEKAISYLRRFR